MFTYNWDSYPEVKEFLIRIFNNSKKETNENYAKEFFHDVEEYLYYLRISKYNFNKIMNRLKKIDTISFFNKQDRKNKLPVITFNNAILVNHNLKENNRLTKEERRRLYIYQALSRNILAFRDELSSAFSRLYSDYLENDKLITETTVNNGWLLLEETLSQELAERITYDTLNKSRPDVSFGLNGEKFPIDEELIESRLDNYRMFENIVISFGLTLSKVGNMFDYSRQMVFYDLIKKSINGDFTNEVIGEYMDKGNTIELYESLYLMGLLINEKYSEYNLAFNSKIKLTTADTRKIYHNINKLAISMFHLDNRGYEVVNIGKQEDSFFIKKRILKLVNEREL